MKVFSFLQHDQAVNHSLEGLQALHLHSIVFDTSPRCFQVAVARGQPIAHLLDQDEERLRETAKELGVKIIVVEHRDTKFQHVDLCAGPLRKCLAVHLYTLRQMEKPLRVERVLHILNRDYPGVTDMWGLR